MNKSGALYGTLLSEVEKIIDDNRIPLLCPPPQSLEKIKNRKYKAHVVFLKVILVCVWTNIFLAFYSTLFYLIHKFIYFSQLIGLIVSGMVRPYVSQITWSCFMRPWLTFGWNTTPMKQPSADFKRYHSRYKMSLNGVIRIGCATIDYLLQPRH